MTRLRGVFAYCFDPSSTLSPLRTAKRRNSTLPSLLRQASAYLPAEYSNLSALLTFVLLAVILAVRPTGLFGKIK